MPKNTKQSARGEKPKSSERFKGIPPGYKIWKKVSTSGGYSIIATKNKGAVVAIFEFDFIEDLPYRLDLPYRFWQYDVIAPTPRRKGRVSRRTRVSKK